MTRGPGMGVHWGYITAEEVGVPKVSVYLPDELHRQVRHRGLSLSAVTQAALERELAARDNARWIDEVGAHPPRVAHEVDVGELLDQVRDEFGA